MTTTSLISMCFLASLSNVDRICRLIEYNESRYANIAVKLHCSLVPNVDVVGKDGQFVSAVNDVWQRVVDGRYRLEARSRTVTKDAEDKFSVIVVYDGQTIQTRITEDDPMKMRRHDYSAFFVDAHSLLLRRFFHKPLSHFMRHPWPNETLPKLEYLGDEVVGELSCCKLRVTATDPATGSIKKSYQFWLARERNFHPVRVLTYSPTISEEIPIAEGAVQEFTELSQGIWYPTLATYTWFDTKKIRNKEGQVWRSRETFHIQGVDFSDNIPREMLKLDL